MTRALLLAAVGLAGAGLAGCDVDLERMIDQPRRSAYEACDACPEGTVMMQPPEGTVPRGELLGPAELVHGAVDGRWVERVPIALDRAVLARGRDRFNIFCAACHGRLGNGVSQVAENMALRLPPNLLLDPYRGYPPGRLFAAITRGFGLMRSYAGELPLGDRWAVVAYVQALQGSQRVPLDALPAAQRQEAARWLR